MASVTLPDSHSLVDEHSVSEWLTLIRAEYLEMPGLNLTARQAQRLWRLDPFTCDRLLNALVASGFLVRTRTGVYARKDETP